MIYKRSEFSLTVDEYKACRDYIKRRYRKPSKADPMLKELAGMWPQLHKQASHA